MTISAVVGTSGSIPGSALAEASVGEPVELQIVIFVVVVVVSCRSKVEPKISKYFDRPRIGNWNNCRREGTP